MVLQPAFHGRVVAVLGPTNTGKTHFAVERMLAHRSGMIGFPLRLLAREIYDRIVAIRARAACALITGEEKLGAEDARLPRLHGRGDADGARGGVPRRRRDPALRRPRARPRVHRPPAARARQRGDHVPGLGHHPADPAAAGARGRGRSAARASRSSPSPATASCTGCRAAARSSRSPPPRSTRWPRCIRRQKGGAAVVLGALSPRTRNAQVAMYQAGEVEHLVATDAIGMGLNMDVAHVAFAQPRQVRRHGAAPPARRPRWRRSPGRAGRHMANGTFGATNGCEPFEPREIEAIEGHSFAPLKTLRWRNSELDFADVEALSASLDRAPKLGLPASRSATRSTTAAWSSCRAATRSGTPPPARSACACSGRSARSRTSARP